MLPHADGHRLVDALHQRVLGVGAGLVRPQGVALAFDRPVDAEAVEEAQRAAIGGVDAQQAEVR
ncbi:MAG: hypothetical protein ACK559_23670, partial [bacterium]